MTNKTTKALKLAGKALGCSQQHLDLYHPEWVITRRQNDEALAAIREALVQPANTRSTYEYSEHVKQEPVAWMWKMHGWVVTAHGKHQAIKRYVDICNPPLETQQSDDFIELIQLYAAPVQREWVELTLQELQACCGGELSHGVSVHAAIAAFKDKNK